MEFKKEKHCIYFLPSIEFFWIPSADSLGRNRKCTFIIWFNWIIFSLCFDNIKYRRSN